MNWMFWVIVLMAVGMIALSIFMTWTEEIMNLFTKGEK